jgi:hypothetical protein
MQPKFLTGDLVTSGHFGEFGVLGQDKIGMIISVRHANGPIRSTDVQRYVYYVLTYERGVTGPWFSSDLNSIESHV